MGSQDQAIRKIEERYELLLQNKGDQPHLPILKEYGEQCDVIVEVGFRSGVSASAFLNAKPKIFMTVDWNKYPFQVNELMIKQMREECEAIGIQFVFVEADVLQIDLPKCDLLFLDGFHTYEHVFLELIKHSEQVSKFILLHDTDEPSCPGMFPAIEDFLLDNPQWGLEERHRDRPGLTVLKRQSFPCNPPQYPQVFLRTLKHAVDHQKQMYYSQIDGTESSNWDQYIRDESVRYSDRDRWPRTNAPTGATEMMEAYLSQAHQKES